MSRLPGSIRGLFALCLSALLVAPFALANATAHGPAHGPAVKGPNFYVGQPVSYGNLTVFPLVNRLGGARTDAYITLDEGIREGTVVITERGGEAQMVRRSPRHTANQVQVSNNSGGGGASVNQLALVNKSGKKLLLLAGEVIVGGKQDRIVEEDLIVPPVSVPVSLSVFCVEHGRWSQQTGRTSAPVIAPGGGAPKQDNFSSLGAISHPTLRGAAQDKKQQGEVWKEVSANNARLGTANSTDTYQEVYASKKVKESMDNYLAALQNGVPGANVVGVVVARGGELFWVDQFASPDLFRKYWPKLLKSYVVEAMGSPSGRQRPTVADAERYLTERSGESISSAKAGVYELVKVEHPRYAIFELWDTSLATPLRLHFNKMQR